MKHIRKVFVAGPANAARSAMVRRLKANGLSDKQIDTWDEDKLSGIDQTEIRSYLRESSPDQVYITAGVWGNVGDRRARSGTYLAEALLGPVQLIHEAMYAGVKKLLFVASHQVYGRCPVLPVAEEDLGYVRQDQLRDAMATAHMAGIQMCEGYTHEFGEVLGLQYRSVVAGNLYGPEDSTDAHRFGELQALMRHIHQAKTFKLSSVSIHSNGLRRDDWLYVDDMAEACIRVMGLTDMEHRALVQPRRSHINLGSGRAHTTMELAEAVARVVGYKGHLKVESIVADDRHDFLLDTHRLRSIGWQPAIDLDTGLAHMYRDYRQQERRVASA